MIIGWNQTFDNCSLGLSLVLEILLYVLPDELAIQ
jgi:hypothetical protein